jgi:hypothetical protein
MDFAIETLTIRPWPDPVIDTLGHDPRSAYVEHFWLSVLGPSTTWLLRRLAAGLEAEPAGFELHLPDTARALGLGEKTGRHGPFVRALGRCCQFGLAQLHDRSTLAVRRKLPPLNRRQVERLPEALQAAHAKWQDDQLHSPGDQLRRRARRLALSLLELGEDLESTERQLGRWKFHPSVSREASAWAWDRHRRALAAAQSAELGGDAA